MDDKVTALKKLLSSINGMKPDKIKGDTTVDIIEQFTDYYKNHGSSGGSSENLTYATEEDILNLFN